MKKQRVNEIAGGVVAAQGFACAGVSCGVKVKPGTLDLGLIVSDRPAAAAAMFTTNRVQAASVRLNKERIKGRTFKGIVVNAGNANACTGRRGMIDAKRMTELAAELTGSKPEQFLNASTGIIGRPLPMEKIEAGIRAAAAGLGSTSQHAEDIARAIMTTDTTKKSFAVELSIGGKKVRIGGICKGAGMIAPNMATMLCFLTTDCAISGAMLRKALGEVVEKSFNSITIDGDCSTNDTIAILANGVAGNARIATSGAAYNAFRDGLLLIAEKLAKSIVMDGEGATRFVEVSVNGGANSKAAVTVARSIAYSPLVKCAVNGGDPNWGRIICAAGYSGANVDPEKMRLWINATLLFKGGMPVKVAKDKLAECMKPKEIMIRLDLGQGKAAARVWTCDFSKEYVTINADYHT